MTDSPSAAGPLPDSYWAGERLLAGPLPQGPDRPALRAAVRALLGAGVSTVIDLRTPAEPPSIRAMLDKLSERAVWIGFPILDGAAPSRATLEAILDAIDGALARGHTVYVHCQGGRGRTGTVIAAWWIRHGVVRSVEAAIDALRQRRVGQPHGSRPSPETAAQLRLLRSLCDSR